MILEIVRFGRDGIQLGQVLEERIAWPGHEDLVAWVAEDLEKQGERIARAGRQHDAIRTGGDTAARVIVRHGAARVLEADRPRHIRETTRVAERRQQIAWVLESRTGRVGFGEIENGLGASLRLFDGAREAIRREARREAEREHPSIIAGMRDCRIAESEAGKLG